MQLRSAWVGVLAGIAVLLASVAARAAFVPDKPAVQSQDASAPAAKDQRGTEQQPFVVKALPSAKPPEVARDEDVTAYSTMALAIITAILAYYTFRLWRANKTLVEGAKSTAAQQAQDMRSSIEQAARSADAIASVAEATKANAALVQGVMQKQMRAYIAVNIGKATYQDANNRFASSPEITNTGLSPARNVSYRMAAAILDAHTLKEYVFPEPAQSFQNDATLSARQTFTINAVVGERYSDDEVVEIMNGERKRLFVWGTVTYDDIFDCHWETKFCHNSVFYKIGDEVKINSWYFYGHNSAT